MVFVFCCDRKRVVSCLAEVWSFEDITGTTFLISQQKTCCDPSLESFWQDGSNEESQFWPF